MEIKEDVADENDDIKSRSPIGPVSNTLLTDNSQSTVAQLDVTKDKPCTVKSNAKEDKRNHYVYTLVEVIDGKMRDYPFYCGSGTRREKTANKYVRGREHVINSFHPEHARGNVTWIFYFYGSIINRSILLI